MIHRFAEGGNFTIDVEDGLAHCRVFKRPELDSATCAALARVKVGLFAELAKGSARGMILDLLEAPVVTGPATQVALADMLSPWELAQKPVSVLLGKASIQKLQFRRLLTEFAPTVGELFYTESAARVWVTRSFRASERPSTRRRR